MTLQEAIATGRKVRLGTTGVYRTRDELTSALSGYNIDQLISDAWMVEPAATSLTRDSFAAHWDAVSTSFRSVRTSRESELFAALAARIFGS